MTLAFATATICAAPSWTPTTEGATHLSAHSDGPHEPAASLVSPGALPVPLSHDSPAAGLDWTSVLVRPSPVVSHEPAGAGQSAAQLTNATQTLPSVAVPLPGALLVAPGAIAVAWLARRALRR